MKRDPLQVKIDALLDEMQRMTDREKREFSEAFCNSARCAGLSLDEASTTLRELARGFAGGFETRPPSCRAGALRAWPVAGRPRADAPCEASLASFLELEEPDLAPVPIDNWRENAFRRAARYSCSIDPFHFADRFCAPGYSFAAIRRSDE